ncbi:MAG: carboxypeptidase-like regulatory domain-containing protein, partial [Bacteroidales bacterium]|nr:carboxypeptidase-like regulatory domain-containing protein [Bacteroidales bacterium]
MKLMMKSVVQAGSFLSGTKRKSWLAGCLFLFIMLYCSSVFAQNGHTVKGFVLDEEQMPVIGATVILKGDNTIGTTTDVNGAFTLSIPEGNQVLVISFVGMESQEIDVGGRDNITVVLEESEIQLEEIVVVGYGRQKKESVVGAISQTTGEVLEKAGGVSNIGAALTGNIPGLITMQGTGEPGDENPVIYIRGQGTWNFGNPLILIDGIERSMNQIDLKSGESISV